MTRRYVFAIVAALATTLVTPYGAFAQDPAPAVAAPPVSAVASPLAEAIRERIDHLRYEKQQDVRGARIIGNELVAKYYEAQQFQPAWQDAAKIDELVASIDDLRNDGLTQRLSPRGVAVLSPRRAHEDAAHAARIAPTSNCSRPTPSCSGSTTSTSARWTRLNSARSGISRTPDPVVRRRAAALLGASCGRRNPRSLWQRPSVARLVPAWP